MAWTIGIFKGKDIFSLCNKPLVTLNASFVTDLNAEFIADPFITKANNIFYLFFEAFCKDRKKGVICYAESTDGIYWCYKSIVLKEHFHLSYPFIFKDSDTYYMIPETAKKGEVRLYKAAMFPHKWSYECTLLNGNYVDSSVIFYNNKWWLFTTDLDINSLVIYFSDSYRGPWIKHSQEAFYINNNQLSRSAGSPIIWNNCLIRFIQDNRGGYGKNIQASMVIKMTPDRYIEHLIEPNPFTAYNQDKEMWCAQGRHHISYEYCKHGLIAAIDGNS